MTEQAQRTVAAFDFDGTITRRDTMLPFLSHTVGWAPTATALAAISVPGIRVAVGRGSRQAAKEALFGRLLTGRPLASLEQAAESFADRLVTDGLRRDTLDRVQAHAAAGHELVVVSASPELWVAPVARRLGFTTVLATRLEVDAAGYLTGRLVGRNCRGPEKVSRLRGWLGDETPLVLAYGDSRGDREMLAFAGEGGLLLSRETRRRRH